MTKNTNAISVAIDDLAKDIAQLTEHEELLITTVPGLTLYRREQVSEPLTGVYEPSICLIAQGAKQVWLGEEIYVYDSERYLFSGLHLPAIAQVLEASREKPYLALKLNLDYREIAQLIAESQLQQPSTQKVKSGMTTGLLTLPLIDAFQRLVGLATQEQDIHIMAPLIRREIYYRFLTGEHGGRLRQIVSIGTQSQKIANAVAWLKSNFTESLRVDELAQVANMGVSTFHHHFRSITNMTPIQYQKQLRLQESRKLMLTERMDAASASYAVGYESPSQFSREYSRMYGNSPTKDIEFIRNEMNTTK